MNGNGRMDYFNGDVYEGRFKNEKKYGMGKLTMAGGTVQEGMWFGDRLNGTITYPGGLHNSGDFINGVPVALHNEDTFSGNDTE